MKEDTFGPGDRRHIITGIVSALISTAAVGAAGMLWLVPVMDEKISQNRSDIAVNRDEIAAVQAQLRDDGTARANLRVTIGELVVEVRNLKNVVERLESRLNRQEDRTFQYRGTP